MDSETARDRFVVGANFVGVAVSPCWRSSAHQVRKASASVKVCINVVCKSMLRFKVSFLVLFQEVSRVWGSRNSHADSFAIADARITFTIIEKPLGASWRLCSSKCCYRPSQFSSSFPSYLRTPFTFLPFIVSRVTGGEKLEC